LSAVPVVPRAFSLVPKAIARMICGKSDPFDATLVPRDTVEHWLLQQSRQGVVMVMWPAEVAIRKNKAALVRETWEMFRPTLNDDATNHAQVAQAYYFTARRLHPTSEFRIQSIRNAEKHKWAALQAIQDHLEAHCQSPQDQKILRNIFQASVFLACCERSCRNWAGCAMHLRAMEKIVGLCGGWQSFTSIQQELVMGSALILASFTRSRPAIDLEALDPGPWHTPTTPDSLASQYSPWSMLRTLSNTSSPQSATTSTRLSILFDELRELLEVEDLKLQLAASTSDVAVRVFRWTHLRKLTIRGRLFHYWCDLVDEAEREGDMTVTAMASVLPVTYEFALLLAVHMFQRAVFDDHYVPGNVYPEAERYYQELVSVMVVLRPVSEDLTNIRDEHSLDALWIYSVGAYVEDKFLRAASSGSGMAPSGRLFFISRFNRLVRYSAYGLDLDEMLALLERQYLYCPRVQEESLRKLAFLSLGGD
jgi:hypothetical protein